MRISYAITVCNEFVEIQRLVNFLVKNKRPEDEIVILYDEGNGDYKVEEFLRDKPINGEFIWHCGKFNNHFADWKNKLTSYCSGDYIFNIDADEIPHEALIGNLHLILEENEVDVILVPRINTVKGLGLSHVKKWGWKITKLDSMIEEKIFKLDSPQNQDEYNLLKEYDLVIEDGEKIKYYTPIVNAFDPQWRIYKNKDSIRWENRVHEKLVGFDTMSNLPWIEELALYHSKKIDRQKKQNEFYDTL